MTSDASPSAVSASTPTEFLQTRRMQLVDLHYGQSLDLLRLGLESRVARHILDAPLDTLRQVVGMIQHTQRTVLERPGLGIWYATDTRGQFIGIFSLMPSTEIGEIEIGTRLLPRAWGRGYALEGGAALCTHAFERLGLPRLIGLCTPDNRSVPPLLQRLGFEPDGRTEQFGRPALRFALPAVAYRGIRRRKAEVAVD
ncbi:GNAT family N-acetyltransferase [Dokdonella sp.]|uniref:GNAT family N-acetyltransferase n=1 Tax=Dokdonella sp. TaxID=2291710 RepID=UPI001B2C1531|nr:GNAT family N-acetyltransferase [Dokdonella sp.]MBO9661664.1 GNAT family N-acetyltransferase [Dokdonella sp.]